MNPNYDKWLEEPYQRKRAKEEGMNKRIEQYDNYEGYRQWLDADDECAGKFEHYVLYNFWNMLGDEFKSLLHPEAANSYLNGSPGISEEWSLYLWLVLDESRLKILIRAFVESERDAFEEWAASED